MKLYNTNINIDINYLYKTIKWNKFKWKNIEDNSHLTYICKTNELDNVILNELLKNLPKEIYNEIIEMDCWLNLYRSGNDYIDWHKDSLNLKPNIKIYTQYILSIGSTRNLLFKNIETNEIYKFILENGSIFEFTNEENENYLHCVPLVENNSIDKYSNMRISMVFYYGL